MQINVNKIGLMLILALSFGLMSCSTNKIKEMIPDKSEDYKMIRPAPCLEVPKDICKEPTTDYYSIP